MSRGKRVPKRVRDYINETAYLHPEWPVFELMAHVTEHFKGTGLHIPGPDSFRKIAKEARRPTEEDNPWSVGFLPALVPTDSLADVLAVWRQCKLKGYRFTARQAKWVARLRLVLRQRSNRRTEYAGDELYEWATRYAARDKANEVRNPSPPLDTSDLDAKLAFSPDIYQAMVDTGLVVELTFERDFQERVGLDPQWVIRSASYDRLERGAEQGDLDMAGELEDIWKAIDDDSKQVEAKDVWLIWVRALSTAPGWKQLPVERHNDLMLDLARQTVAWYGPDIPGAIPVLRRISGRELAFQPSAELLAEVGYVIHGWRNLDDND